MKKAIIFLDHGSTIKSKGKEGKYLLMEITLKENFLMTKNKEK